MMYYTPPTACAEIIRHYGIQAQKTKFMEELAELIQAVAKSPEGIITDNMVEEIADVKIMLMQFAIAFTPDQDKLLDDMVTYKLRRQLTRMEDEE